MPKLCGVPLQHTIPWLSLIFSLNLSATPDWQTPLGHSSAGARRMQTPVVSPQLFQDVTCKLSPIVCHQAFRHTKPAHYVLPYKALDLVCGDLGHWLCFDPLGEVLNRHYQVLHLPDRQWEGSQNVNFPSMERPGAVNRLQLFWGCLVPIGVLLALLATLGVSLAIQ